MRLKKRLEQALGDLNTTPERLATLLEKYGPYAIPKDHLRCIVALYLSEALGESVSVGWGGFDDEGNPRQEPAAEVVRTPRAEKSLPHIVYEACKYFDEHGNLVPHFEAEIERLRAQLAAKDAEIARLRQILRDYGNNLLLKAESRLNQETPRVPIAGTSGRPSPGFYGDDEP